ncbi:MAG: hypothetical protein LBM96_09080 [Methanobrevibacter sp.]|jgi:hypothetical protein|nr:hypothetical protein [Candidatus Methanoflexus mossambicus]
MARDVEKNSIVVDNKNYAHINNDPNRAIIRKRRRFERWDGYKPKSLESFRKLMPFVMRTRNGSVNFFEDTFDVTEVVKYLDEKNKKLDEAKKSGDLKDFGNGKIPKYSYNLFFITLIVRLLTLRPWLNRFISRKNIYQRHDVEIAFPVKKQFDDVGEESTRFEVFDRDSNIEDVGEIIFDSIKGVKQTTRDPSGDFIGTATKLPNIFLTCLVLFLDFSIAIGFCPDFLRRVDTMQSSVLFSNLGSIGLKGAPHHHLYDRGTSSLLITAGSVRKEKIINIEDIDDIDELMNNKELLKERYVVDIKISMDERIADGFYYIKSFKLLEEILKNPYQLDERLKEVPIDD